MATKKKSQFNRTGLYYFAVESRQSDSSLSRKSIHDVIISLLPRWRSMSLISKKPYEDLAKQEKRLRMLNNENVDTPIIPSSEEATFIETNCQENLFLNEFFSSNLREIYHRDLFFVTFQIFCRTDDEDGGDYYPAEMAIMKYSFAQSVREEYFTIMKPEKFPLGYTGTVIDLSRQTHQIPPFDFIGANGDYERIWFEIERILGQIDSKRKIIIFCHAFEREQTKYLLNWLASKANRSSRKKVIFEIYSFEALVVAVLRRLGIGDYAHQSVREQLHRPVYTLQIKERCVYHQSLAIQYCARVINNGFRLFLDDFVRQRFLDLLPEEKSIVEPMKSLAIGRGSRFVVPFRSPSDSPVFVNNIGRGRSSIGFSVSSR